MRSKSTPSMSIHTGEPGNFMKCAGQTKERDFPDLGWAMTLWNCWAARQNSSQNAMLGLPIVIPFVNEIWILTPLEFEVCLLTMLNQVRHMDGSKLNHDALIIIYQHIIDYVIEECEHTKFIALKYKAPNVLKNLTSGYIQYAVEKLKTAKERITERRITPAYLAQFNPVKTSDSTPGASRGATEVTTKLPEMKESPVIRVLHRRHMGQVIMLSRRIENTLWERDVFNLTSAKGLSYAAFFYLCKCFRLLTVQQHYNLTTKDFTWSSETDENGKTKTFLTVAHPHMRGQDRMWAKCWMDENSGDHNACIVIRKYLKTIPTLTRPGESQPFYLEGNSDKMLYFSTKKIQELTLGGYLRQMLKEGGISGNYSLESFIGFTDPHTIELRSSEDIHKSSPESGTPDLSSSDEPTPKVPTPSPPRLTDANGNEIESKVSSETDSLPMDLQIKCEPMDAETQPVVEEPRDQPLRAQDEEVSSEHLDNLSLRKVSEVPTNPGSELKPGLPPGYVVHNITRLAVDPEVVYPPPKRTPKTVYRPNKKPAEEDTSQLIMPVAGIGQPAVAEIISAAPAKRQPVTETVADVADKSKTVKTTSHSLQEEVEKVANSNLDKKAKCFLLLSVVERLIANPESDEQVLQARQVLEQLNSLADNQTLPESVLSPPSSAGSSPTQQVVDAPTLRERLLSPPMLKPAELPPAVQLPKTDSFTSPTSVNLNYNNSNNADGSVVQNMIEAIADGPVPNLAKQTDVTETKKPGMTLNLSEIIPHDGMIRPWDITITKKEDEFAGSVQITVRYLKMQNSVPDIDGMS